MSNQVAPSRPDLLAETPPSPHWALSVVAAIFGLIFGWVALYFSWQVNRRFARGDVRGATGASSLAMTYSLIGIAMGLCLLLLFGWYTAVSNCDAHTPGGCF